MKTWKKAVLGILFIISLNIFSYFIIQQNCNLEDCIPIFMYPILALSLVIIVAGISIGYFIDETEKSRSVLISIASISLFILWFSFEYVSGHVLNIWILLNYHVLNRPIHYDEVAVMRRILIISLLIALGFATVCAAYLLKADAKFRKLGE